MASGGDSVARSLNRLWYSSHPAIGLLRPFSAFMAGLIAIRRRCYAAGLLRAAGVEAFVVVVGNLSVGGTGKTPVSLWLARALSARGLSVGVVTSGYGGTGRRPARSVTVDSDPFVVGDEAVLAARETRCPVAAGQDRVEAARLLVREHRVDVIVADDGLQHLRLARNFEIAVVDGERGLGSGLCIPFGPLREPPARLASVDAVIVNGGGWSIEGAIRCTVVPTTAVEAGSGKTLRIEDLCGQRVHAVAALGNPERFFGALEAAGVRAIGHAHRDHRALSATDVTFDDGLPVLVTAKDAVKLPGDARRGVWVVDAELRFAEPSDAERLVESILGRARANGSELMRKTEE